MKYIIILLTVILFLYEPIKFVPEIFNPSASPKTINKNQINLIFRNDDLSGTTDLKREARVLNTFNSYGIMPIYAVIPALNNKILTKNDPVIDSLKSWNKEGKIVLALHGFTHEKNRFNGGEFKGEPFSQQFEAIKKGKAILDSLLETNIKIFCPPWDQGDQNTVIACNKAGLTVYSGFLCAESVKNEIFFGSTNNLFNGPLSSLEKAIKYAASAKNRIILLSLFHSSYEYNENGRTNLDSTLSFVKTIANINIPSPDSVIYNSQNILNVINDVYGQKNIKGEMLSEKSTVMKLISRLFGINVSENMDKDLLLFQNAVWTNDDIELNYASLTILKTGWLILFIQRIFFSIIAVLSIIYYYKLKIKYSKICLILSWLLLITITGYVFSGFSVLEYAKLSDLIFFLSIISGSLTIAYLERLRLI